MQSLKLIENFLLSKVNYESYDVIFNSEHR